MNSNSDDGLLKVLSLIGIHSATAHGQYVKVKCPFHEGSTGRTLWIDRETGVWGCWSTRCPRQSGGSLRYLLYVHGYTWEQSESIVETHACLSPLAMQQSDGPVNLEDLDQIGAVTAAHLSVWRVDWHLALEVLRKAASSPHLSQCFMQPVSTWTQCPASPGTLEHDCWAVLWYLLGKRRVAPAVLQQMDVGFDRTQGVFTFPLRSADGKLLGIARREAKDKVPYQISGSARHYTDPEYVAVPVERGSCLWGWFELQQLIQEGAPIVVVEGYIDQLKLLEYGLCSVAKLGKKLTKVQLELLMGVPNPIVHWPDNDTDGLTKGPEDVIATMMKPGVRVVVHPPGVKDAGECSRLVAQAAVRHAMTPLQFLERVPQLLVAANTGH